MNSKKYLGHGCVTSANFTGKAFALSLTIRLTSTNKKDATSSLCWWIEGPERSYVFAKTVSYLLNSQAMDDAIAKVTLEIESFKKHNLQTTVQFAEDLKAKALRCKVVVIKQDMKSVFIEG